MSKKILNAAQSLGKHIVHAKGNGQAHYDYDDVQAHGNTTSDAGFMGDCWREEQYDRLQVKDGEKVPSIFGV